MASNLLNTGYGADALREAVCDQIRRRMRRWFKRNTVIAFDNWVEGNKLANFDFSTVLGNLNIGHDQEIYNLYQLLKDLELGYGTVNADFRVNAVTGDDENGDGSVDAPFASMTRVFRLLPKYINSAINIILTAPTANPITAMPDLDIEFGPEGQLTIQGASNPNVIAAPLVSTGWANIGAGGTYAHALTVAGAGWAPNMFQGYFVHVTSGANSGAFYAIASNTADTIIVPVTTHPMAPGDSFSILQPGDYIKLDFVKWAGTFKSKTLDVVSRFVMTNIRFENIVAEFSANESIDLYFPFCKINNLLTSGNNISLNRYIPYDDSQIGYPDFRPLNPFTYIETLENKAFRLSFYDNVCENPINNWGHQENKNIIWQNYQSYNASSNEIDHCYCFNPSADTVEIYDFSRIEVTGLWIEQSAFNGFNIYRAGSLYSVNLEGTPANIAGYAVLLGPAANYSFNGTPVSGNTNDVYWQVTALAAAFPGVGGTGITDGFGAWVIKLT